MAKYLVYAGCDNEGQVLQGQPYNGPIDSESVAEFALATLRKSPYHSSNTAWGLESLEWQGLENGCEATEPVYLQQDFDAECFDDCDAGNCQCSPPEYWVAVSLAPKEATPDCERCGGEGGTLCAECADREYEGACDGQASLRDPD